MGERGGDEDRVVAAEAEVLDLHHRRPGQRVVAVQDAFRLAGRAGGEEELGRAPSAPVCGRRSRRRRAPARRARRRSRASARRRSSGRAGAPSAPTTSTCSTGSGLLGPRGRTVAVARPSPRRARQHRRDLLGVLPSAELVGDDQHPGLRAAQRRSRSRARGRSASARSRSRRSSCRRGSGSRTRPSSAAGRRPSRPARPRARAAATRPCRPRGRAPPRSRPGCRPPRTSTTASSPGRSRAQRPTQSTIGTSAAWSIAIDSIARWPESASPVADRRARRRSARGRPRSPRSRPIARMSSRKPG